MSTSMNARTGSLAQSQEQSQPQSPTQALAIGNLDVTIGDHPILTQVSLDIGVGARVGLIGASGSGKSMLSRSILGLLPSHAHASGSIRLFGHELIGASDRELADMRGRTVSMIFQNPASALNPVMKIGRQIALPLQLHYHLPADERLRRVKAMLSKVGVPQSMLNAYPHQLSGGQQQRVAIASALITAPRLIIADEPTTALDSITQLHILDLLVDLVDQAGASLLFITHDFGVLTHVTSRCYVMDHGHIIEHGATSQMLENPVSPVTRQLAQSAEELKFATLHDRPTNEGDDDGRGRE
ncbi:ABC transporter ATP-binding protein [Bifidobacterium aquikefiricola]|uniref:ABC transporter ATP-binding protein n=1 Tax=Bifidobacterium aquikefiricola TaxID=3059038 RepID=A0AB39U813_9BIFI